MMKGMLVVCLGLTIHSNTLNNVPPLHTSTAAELLV